VQTNPESQTLCLTYTPISSSVCILHKPEWAPHFPFSCPDSYAVAIDVVISFQRHCKEPGGENVSHTWHFVGFSTCRILPHSIVLPSTHTKDDTLQNRRNFCDYVVSMNAVSRKYIQFILANVQNTHTYLNTLVT